jgi:hypothetical protein
VTKAGEMGMFAPLETFIEDFLALDRTAFLEKHPNAVVVFDDLNLGTEVGATFQTLAKKPQQHASAARGTREKLMDRLEGKWVFPLRKKDDKFACMITVGRAANNVMRLNVASVSKFHAYFTHVARDKNWYIADANSSNGTFIDGQDLPPSHGKVPLKNGLTLRFGPDVTGRFYEANALYDLLQGYTRDSSSAEGPLLPRDATPDLAGDGA